MDVVMSPLCASEHNPHYGLEVYASVEDVVEFAGADEPMHVLFPDALERAAHSFLDHFHGDVLYAVKCNPHEQVLSYLSRFGVRHFDVASIAEIDGVLDIAPDAHLYYMHPVKSRHAIRYAYGRGVRDFAIDCMAELSKILEETSNARDLNLYVRLAQPKGSAAYDLSGKFGCRGEEAVELLQVARRHCDKLAVSFHVGSQCMSPSSYAAAIKVARSLVDVAGVDVDILDVGGGFPVDYPGMTPPPVSAFLDAIHQAVVDCGWQDVELKCEPGRAMVADSGSLLVKVEMRRGDKLYINDGTYGSLYDAGSIGWRYPTRKVGGDNSAHDCAYSFYGPTCDSHDYMEGPFHLPSNIDEGQWIEVGMMGAYGAAMRTQFNGFKGDHMVLVTTTPEMLNTADDTLVAFEGVMDEGHDNDR